MPGSVTSGTSCRYYVCSNFFHFGHILLQVTQQTKQTLVALYYLEISFTIKSVIL